MAAFGCVGFRPWSGASSEEEEEAYQNPQLEVIAAAAQTATEAYRTSILALGSSAQRAMARSAPGPSPSPSPSPHARRQAHRPALIDEREVVGDDWLVQDVQPPSRKRRELGSLGGILSSDTVRPPRERKRARLSTAERRHLGPDAHAFRASEAEGVSRESLDRRSAVPPPHVEPTGGTDHVSGSGSESSGQEDDSLPVLTHGVRRADTGERVTDSARSTEAPTAGEGQGRFMDMGVGAVPERRPCADTLRQCGPFLAPTPVGLARVKVKIEGSVFLIPLPAA